MELPILDKSLTNLVDRVEAWNALLEEHNSDGVHIKMVGGHEIKLNAKPRWF